MREASAAFLRALRASANIKPTCGGRGISGLANELDDFALRLFQLINQCKSSRLATAAICDGTEIYTHDPTTLTGERDLTSLWPGIASIVTRGF